MKKCTSLLRIAVFSFLFLPFLLSAQPANDDPCSAIELIAENAASCEPAAPVSWTDATASQGIEFPGCGSYTTGDIWYKFTLVTAADIFITTLPGTGLDGITDSGMALYYSFGSCEDSLYVFKCDDDGGVGSMSQLYIPASPAGNYYVRFWDYNDKVSANFGGICLATIPVPSETPNDDPCTATLLEVVNEETCDPMQHSVSWANATATIGVDNSLCGSYLSGDVWFKFILDDTSDIYITTSEGTGDNAITDGAFVLYKADACNGALEELACQSDQGADLMPKRAEAQQLPGEYYIRFYDTNHSTSGNIGICVSAQPSLLLPLDNDDPCGAIELLVTADTTCIPDNPQTWINATSSPGVEQPRCGSYERGDVWFSFTLDQPSDVYITTLAGTGPFAITDGAMAIYTGDDCLMNLFHGLCDDDSGPGSMPQIKEKHFPAGKYYIRFWDYNDRVTGEIGGICVAAIPSVTFSVNDHCFTAIAFPPIPADGSCSIVDVNSLEASGPGSDLCDGIADDDVWYDFVVPDGVTSLTFKLLNVPQNVSPVVRLMEGSCNNLFTLGCYNSPEGVFTDLIPGDLYTIKTFTEEEEGAEYQICIAALIPVINDDPCGSMVLTAEENTDDCIPMQPFTWEFATGSSINLPPCGSYSTGDVWFSFTLTEKSDITIRTAEGTGPDAIDDGAMAIYKQGSDCNDLYLLACQDDVDSENYMPAIADFAYDPGTYYVRFWEYSDRVSGNIKLCLSTRPSVSTVDNDHCTGAFPFPEIPVDGSCATVHINNEGATGSLQTDAPGYPDDDLWYSFVVPEGGNNLVYEFTTIRGNSQHILCFYSACDADALQECYYIYNSEYGTLEGLSTGNTYYLRVYTGEADVYSEYDLCLRVFPEPPANDECENAIPFPEIPLDGSCVVRTANVTWSTVSLMSDCGFEEGDVWFSFVMPDAPYVDVLMLDEGRYASQQMEVYSGACGSLNSIYCLPDFYRGSSRLWGLIPGETYFLRISTTDPRFFLFDICMKSPLPPPSNDECPQALPYPEILSDGSCSSLIVDVTGATGNNEELCYPVYDDDVWYSFILPDGATGVYISNTPITSFGAASMVIYRGTCDALEYLGCHSYPESVINGLTGGQTYYLRVQTANTNRGGTFEICLQAIMGNAVNDECNGAIPFPPLPLNGDWVGMQVNTYNGTNSNVASCFPFSDPNDDLWYSFEMPDGFTDLMVRYNFDPYIEFELFSGGCEAPVSIGCGDNGTGGFTGLTPGETYYLLIYNADATKFSNIYFELKLPLPISNDFCEGAIEFPPLPLDGSCISMTANTFYATDDGIPNCFSGPNNAVWFKFTAPSDRSVVHFSIFNEPSYVPSIQIFEGTCDNLTWIECIQLPFIDDFSDLTPGQEYYIQIFPGDDGLNEIELCLGGGPLPPSNDHCENALSITSTPGQFADPGIQTTGGATDSDTDRCFPGVFPVDKTYDVWYSFTTDQDGGDAVTSVTFRDNEFAFSFSAMVIHGMEGECGNFHTLGCYEPLIRPDGYRDTVVYMYWYDLAPLTKYYFRVYPGSGSHHYADMDFTIHAEGSALNPIVATEDVVSSSTQLNKAFPSPASSYVYVDYTSKEAGRLELKVLDMVGNIVSTQKPDAREGNNQTMLNVSGLPPGLYVIVLSDGLQKPDALRILKM